FKKDMEPKASRFWFGDREHTRLMSSKHWVCLVNTDHYQELTRGLAALGPAPSAARKLYLHFLKRPSIYSGWRKVTMLCAHFEKTLQHQIWSRIGVRFQQIGCGPKPHQVVVEIHYALEGKTSRTRIRRTPDLLERYLERCPIGGNVLVQANKADEERIGDRTLLPHSSNGSSEYQDKDTFVGVGAFRQHPVHIEFLQALGLNGRDLWRATHLEPIYQGLCRMGPVRDPRDKRIARVYVPDEDTARELAKRFATAKVVRMDVEIEEN